MKQWLCWLLGGHRWRRLWGERGLFPPRGALDICTRCNALWEMRPYPDPPTRKCIAPGCPFWGYGTYCPGHRAPVEEWRRSG